MVPCFNESDCIAETAGRIVSSLVDAEVTNYEIIFVNDGSVDSTLAQLIVLQKSNKRIFVVDLSRNHGHQLALSAGLSVAKGERVLIIDADLQDPPELIGQMMKALDQGADVAYGQRISRVGESWFKKQSAKIFYRFLAGSSNVKIPVNTGDFRLMTRQVLDVLLSMPEAHRYIRGMIAWVGFNQVAIPYDRAPRFAGATKYPLRKMLALAIDASTSFAATPLRFMYIVSMCAGISALLLFCWSVFVYFQRSTVPGWTSLMCVVLAFMAVQMFSQAILGEYVARTFLQSKQRPLFVIRRIYGVGK